MSFTTLISTDELYAHLGEPNWAIVDCRFQLGDDDYGRRAYEEAHIPGAVFADLNRDLSGVIVPGETGRHPLPSIEFAVEKFSEWGIDADTQVVVYDDKSGGARLWWMPRWLGHKQVAVLDGGWQKWQREGRPTNSGIEQREPRTFIPNPRPDKVIEAEDVLSGLDDPTFRLIDARAASRYRGEAEPVDPIAGHIPTAVSSPHANNLNEDGVHKSPEELREMYQDVLDNEPAEGVVVYCGSGVTATRNILAMLHAGLGEAKLYAGSWSEWIIEPTRPIVTDTT